MFYNIYIVWKDSRKDQFMVWGSSYDSLTLRLNRTLGKYASTIDVTPIYSFFFPSCAPIYKAMA